MKCPTLWVHIYTLHSIYECLDSWGTTTVNDFSKSDINVTQNVQSSWPLYRVKPKFALRMNCKWQETQMVWPSLDSSFTALLKPTNSDHTYELFPLKMILAESCGHSLGLGHIGNYKLTNSRLEISALQMNKRSINQHTNTYKPQCVLLTTPGR
jgi:hypothetical protein